MQLNSVNNKCMPLIYLILIPGKPVNVQVVEKNASKLTGESVSMKIISSISEIKQDMILN